MGLTTTTVLWFVAGVLVGLLLRVIRPTIQRAQRFDRVELNAERRAMLLDVERREKGHE